ncbi:MAG: UDP-N-acetylmuramoyl-tripeptide--D-alanyl-D-alanine ligase [bacterium]|nr:UDP-N-acetylmuramoyl-tripeptide--D-alanyl-D-alanine ligase [bacterium]
MALREKSLEKLRWILKKLAQLTLLRYHPGVITVTGSVGKTSTKLAIAAVVGSMRSVRASSRNYNNEIGVPFTVISGREKVGGPIFWLSMILAAAFRIVFKMRYPEILVLEYGADRPGDIKYLLEIARPTVAVITAVGDIPAHVEYYAGSKAVAREKGRTIETLPAAGFAVLNFDDATVMDLEERTRAKVMTFGFGDGADVRVTNFETRSADDGRPVGIAFKLECGGSVVPVRLDGVFGKAQGYAAAAAACVGLIFGMNLVKISEALADYQPASGRMTLLAGIKGTFVIDDTYNASPLSMHAALDTLRDLSAKGGSASGGKARRKVAVLGDMLEIGKYAIEAHEELGRLAAKVVDTLITVGPRAKFIAEGAKVAGMPKKKIMSFDSADEAKVSVQGLLRKGDIVLLKASRAIGLDKIVEEIRQF